MLSMVEVDWDRSSKALGELGSRELGGSSFFVLSFNVWVFSWARGEVSEGSEGSGRQVRGARGEASDQTLLRPRAHGATVATL